VEGRELDSRRAGRTSADLTLELPWLGLILLSALALRISVLMAIEPTPLAGDETDYYRRAVHLVSDGRMESLGGRAPGNEFFFAALFRLFGISTLVARFGNVVLSAASVVPIYALGRQLGGGRTGLVAAALTALYPNFIAYSHYLWAEPLYILLVTSGLALLGSQRGRPALWRSAVAGLLFGVAALAREVGVVFPLFGAAWLYFVSRAEPGKAAARSGLLLAAFALVLVPWTLHLNAGREDFALVTRTFYMNLYKGNVEPQRVDGEERPVGLRKSYWSLGRGRIEAERGARVLAFDAIEQRMPWWPAEKLIEQLPRFFTPTSFAVRRLLMAQDELEPLGSWRYRFRWARIDTPVLRWFLVGVAVTGYVAMAVAGVGGLILARCGTAAGLLALFAMAQIGPTLVTFALSRFRLATMAVLIVGAATLVRRDGNPWTAATPGRRRAAVAGMAILMAVILCRYQDALRSTWG
jgi:4-amino-4-deoxy-L-arabinose transferase-like glycosyltransferase